VAIEQVVVVGEIDIRMSQDEPRRRRARIEYHGRRVLKVLLLCCALQLVGCAPEQRASSEVVAEINALDQRTIGPDSNLQSEVRITNRPASVQADCQIRNSGATEQYFEWVKQQLGADYHVVSQTKSVLTMGKRLSGDAYTVEFRSNSSRSNIDVHFFATSD
jgi:hypothetical protein